MNGDLTLGILSMALVAGLGGPGVAQAQGLGKTAMAGAPTELLGGRLQATFPKGARVEQRRRSVMSAAQPVQEETRVVLQVGSEKLVVMVYELFASDGGDFEGRARRAVAQWAPDAKSAFAVTRLKTALPAMAVRPQQLQTQREAVLVLGLYTRLADGLIQYTAFYVNPAAAKDEAGVRSLANRIAGTMTAGSKVLDLSAGRRRLPGLSAKTDLTVTLPAGWAHTITQGPDFLVHRLRRTSGLGEPTRVLSVYLGGHPSFQHRRSKVEGLKVVDVKGALFGGEVTWKRWSRPARSGQPATTTMETIVEAPGDGRLRAHVFFTATDAESLRELRVVAATLKAAAPR